MISLQHFRHRQDRTPVAWWLACLLVVQALFPIQAHTAWRVAGDGEVMQICTLQGAQSVLVTPDGEQPAADDGDGRSAACVFSQLLAEAVSSAGVAAPGWLAMAAAVSESPLPRGLPIPTLRRLPIRAPPAAV